MIKTLSTLVLMVSFFMAPAFAQAQQYTCPMHPHYMSDKSGTCPICGMDLVALDAEDTQDSASQSSGEQKILYWQAPMDPNFKSDKPGKSPMGMDLVPIYGEEMGDNTGRAIVTITPETIQNSGVRSEKVQMASFGNLVRSYGDVTENVRLQYDISSRVEGWIDNLKVQAIGDEVKKGDILFTLYSPALISAQRDFLGALQTGIKGRINSGAKRLISLGMQQRAIDEIKSSKKSFQNIPFYASVDGVISMINIREGSYAKPGMTLIAIQNYSSVWIDVSVAEQDTSYITDKTKATVSFPALGIKEKTAQIDYIYPTIDKSTRTGRVRLVLDNAEGTLKPGAYADIEFETDVKPRLSVPSDAVLKSKMGDFVVISLGEGRFQPKKITAGLHYKNHTEVLEGIHENDNVVVSGQFLIDSESSLRESFRKMKPTKSSETTESPVGGAHAGH